MLKEIKIYVYVIEFQKRNLSHAHIINYQSFSRRDHESQRESSRSSCDIFQV